ncbi:MAG: radical SAM protein, partial [Omnitrophica bacterium]|nr:radical SAM protein [Candidatus Omnitrophota bacterium]
MARIWLWNSIATRKRSPSDGFLENGLAILKGDLEGRGHSVRVIDWQKNEFYDSLCPKWARSINRLSTAFMFWLAKKGKIYAKLYFLVFNALQEMVNSIRRDRMKRTLKEFGDEVLKSGIKIFGAKIWYGEAFLWADWLADYIKRKDPSILLVAGGFHATLYEEDFLKNSVFDLAVISEGEKPLRIILGIVDKNLVNWDKGRVVDEIKARIDSEELKNMVYRDKTEVRATSRYTPEMDKKSFPKYEKENIEGKLKIHVLLDSLGCPWGKCSFCVHSHFYPRFYPRPVEDIVSEMEYMIKQGIGLFRFAGSETPPAFGIRIAKAILEKGLRVKYSTGCRPVNRIGESEEKYNVVVKDYETMLRAGLRAIFMGGETGNDTINDRIMNKGVNKDDIIKTAKAFREAQKGTGIQAYLSLALIYPAPLVGGISLEDVFRDDMELIEKVAPDSV